MSRSLFRVFNSLIISVFIMGFASTAVATPLIVDLRTDYLPGQEFINTLVTIDGGIERERIAYTTRDYVTGERAAEYDLENNRVYRVEISLITPDQTVLDSRAILVDLRDPTAVTGVIARTAPPVLSCEEDLILITEERDQLAADLMICQDERDQCVDTDLPACITARDDFEAAKRACDMNLETCTTGLNACNSRLSTLESDDDGDGIIAVLDICDTTPPGSPVDATGCSQEEFCSSILVSTPSDNRLCRRADWKNDEGASLNPADCDVDAGGLCTTFVE